MVCKKRKVVSLAVDQSFFDDLFEPARKKAQKAMGLERLSQGNFTKMLKHSGLKLDLKIKSLGVNYVPKKNKRKKR